MQIEQSIEELQALLEEQLQFIDASCRAYDAGFAGEVKRLAVSVRVLVHDTKASTSLLKLLDHKSIDFVDTSVPYEEENLASHSSLVTVILGRSGSYPAPLLDDGPFFRRVNFEAWWNGIVFVDKLKGEFSRKDIVLSLANKEGGAHVDSHLDQAYADLRRHNSLAVFDISNDGRETPAADQVPAAMRQIAHELLCTLRTGYSCRREVRLGDCVLTMGASIIQSDIMPPIPDRNLPKNRPEISGRKIGRNDLCFCGSGKKYKKCCLR